MLKVISGGQTGVDRAALDAAIELGMPYGGWCPRGGWAEDLAEPPGLRARYPELHEAPSADPLQRTEWNVRDSDRLMILVDRRGLAVSNGCKAARNFALALGRPSAVIALDAPEALASARAFLAEGRGPICIAGPREGEAPGIYAKARPLLCAVFAGLDRRSLNRM